MAAFIVDLYIEQGTDYYKDFQLKTGTSQSSAPRNLTGFTGRGQIRSTYDATITLAEFTVTIVDAANGIYALVLTNNQTSLIPVDPSSGYELRTTKYPYQVELIAPNGKVERTLQGIAEISPEVAR